ncbi:F-box protein [Criblamydia sequanensis]|uniref:F-box domain-containing protein n=1 Tax=Candidatus Criblamydia sequanensis CRIB-18 TaxID=1437425 RepID=A0A090D127_9BACT|nr:F-box protein [Criblamydia sequanensis]CDR33610.1 F-box domain-containing protein [Criblamydia sequanensis CRIB-18]
MNLTINSNNNNRPSYEALDPVSFLPDELVMAIFSCLNLSSLGTIGAISKSWKLLAEDPALWKNAIYREIAFTNDIWAKVFGEEVVKDEDRKEEYSSFPWKDFISDCRKFKSLFPEKNAKEFLMIVRLPKTLNGQLNLKNLGELSKKCFKDSETGYNFIWPTAMEEFGEKSIDKSVWVIMTKDVLPGSRSKSYIEQQEMVRELAEKTLTGYGISNILKYSACILSQYFFDPNYRSFSSKPWTFTRSTDQLKGNQIVAGGVSANGLTISFSQDDKHTGVAILRDEFEKNVK